MMDYAIMWEIDNAGGVADLDDLFGKSCSFPVLGVFSDGNHMKLDGNPILFVYDFKGKLLELLGGADGLRAAFEAADVKVKELRFCGMSFTIEYRYDETDILAKYRER